MGKIFFAPSGRADQTIKISGPQAHHIKNVLRIRVGQEVLLCDGACMDYNARVSALEPEGVCFEIIASYVCEAELKFPMTLFQGLPKGDKMEWIIEKAVELGVSAIVPVVTEHTVVKVKDADKKKERYNRIALSAASQSMRGVVPHVSAPMGFAAALEMYANSKILVAYEKERRQSVKSAIANLPPQPVALWIGPEGGFSENEVAALTKMDAITMSLGPRILRTETAGLVAAAQIISTWE